MGYIAHIDTPLGPVTLASDGTALTGLWFDGQKHFGSTLGEDAGPCIEAPELPIFAETARWLEVYFRGEVPGFTPEVSFGRPRDKSGSGASGNPGASGPSGPHGRSVATEFRILVWQELQKIPYGQTVTYGELARRIEALPVYAEAGRRVSARAVGGAVGQNPISLIVPCHRVVGAGGKLTGYAGGVEQKRRLLELEQSGT